MRFCLRQDDDSHWYLIEVSQAEWFGIALQRCTKEQWDEFEDDFGDKRINGPHRVTFTDPTEE